MPRPILLSGKVAMSDGMPPPERVRIERVCDGVPRIETHTDSKGNFSFRLGQNLELLPEAGETAAPQLAGSSGNDGSTVRQSELSDCDIRAWLPGFRSDSISLAARRSMDNPDLGTIVLHRLGNAEGLTVSATSMLAPKSARKAYRKGLEDARKNKLDAAEKQFEKASGIYPKFAAAWFELGKIDERRNRVEEARQAYARALAADSKYVNPYERLYLLAFKESKWHDVEDLTGRVIHLNPYEFPAAYYFNAVANLHLDKLDAAEKSGREAVRADTAHRNPRTVYLLGLILGRKRNFRESAQCFRAYLSAAPNAPDAAAVRTRLAQAEQLAQSPAQP